MMNLYAESIYQAILPTKVPPSHRSHTTFTKMFGTPPHSTHFSQTISTYCSFQKCGFLNPFSPPVRMSYVDQARFRPACKSHAGMLAEQNSFLSSLFVPPWGELRNERENKNSPPSFLLGCQNPLRWRTRGIPNVRPFLSPEN